MAAFDEFSLLRENADEAGLPWAGAPEVARVETRLADGRALSGIRWGGGEPDAMLLHGGAQNAHTWDTLALALDRPILALDLPGHGRSSWRADGEYRPATMADDVATAMPRPMAVIGMSLGGLTAISLAARYPDLVTSLALIDITPGVNADKSAAIQAFVAGPESFAGFEDILGRTIEHNPTRSEPSLRRGVLHNAVELDDGRWAWRHHLGRGGTTGPKAIEFAGFWDDLSKLGMPIMLVRGALSPVVDDDDVAELLRRQPSARVEVVDGAGHSIQGDRPLQLAEILRTWL